MLQPVGHRRFQFGVDRRRHSRLNLAGQGLANLYRPLIHAETVFGVIFKQGEAPGRAMPLRVRRIGDGRRGRPPDGRATGGVGDHHAVAEELRHQFGVRSLAATGAGTGELLQRLGKLTSLDRQLLRLGNGLFRQADGKFPPFLALRPLAFQRLHHQRLGFGRADVDAIAAARAIQRGYRQVKPEAGEANSGLGDEACRRRPQFVVADQDRPDHRVRTDKGALVALDAVVGLPLWRFDGNAPLFPGRPAQREGPVLAAIKGADRQPIPLFAVHGNHHVFDEFRQGLVRLPRRIFGSFPGIRHHDPDQTF